MRSILSTGTVCGGLFFLTVVGLACTTEGTGGGVDPGGAAGECDPSAESGGGPAPSFPGSGMSGAGDPITAALDPGSCGAARLGVVVDGTTEVDCYYTNNDQTTPMAFVERVVEIAEGDELVHVRLTLNPAFVDNSYGETAIGWGGDADQDPGGPDPGGPGPGGGPKPKGHGGHTFKDLVGSDKAEFQITDGTGELVLDFYVDYVSVDDAKPSGYGSLGVLGGEGKMLVGDAGAIVAATTSIDRDLNACGYGAYTVDSPATDESYTPSDEAPNWDYRVVYDVWLRASAFGDAGFGDAVISYVHASPSKYPSDTVVVTPGPCPPTPCEDEDPPGGEGGEGGAAPGGDPGGDPGGEPTCRDQGGECQVNADCCSYSDYCLDGTCQPIEVPR
ncbi:hypothetical protein SOCE26_018370 [Sorangium cellulosum]|uniref:Uncharacterized protein n=1 Tax=Sorangium cellulosum TaxID=56 RepID=A0A2L0EMB1_SORCE|nr:hypothetical protein [Sorangium cellulosum]AUX40436.1 hypothetical protein SOCE26_018370 [Sorangium cellulosum]